MAYFAGEPIGKYLEFADLIRHALSNGLGQQRRADFSFVEPGPDAVQWPGNA
ncbi:hypothetical protein [Azohydromonas lata]|uniref:Uncharacterized protein n=1 Tax=Azohydromonas lata TaxID=45677 RepID=A0ABU5IK06_9BURK|nr:hypothetical protein [Azohydromonas lata]MDZ5459242.1 hypothetical protein [Azohydromonas lata]